MLYRMVLIVCLALWLGAPLAAAAEKDMASAPADINILYTTDTRSQIKCKG